jgi:phenylalanyl-tRNA synthetase alpha chain
MKELIYSLHPLEREVLPHSGKGSVAAIARAATMDPVDVRSALLMLEQHELVKLDWKETIAYVLDKLGQKYQDSDLPEVVLLKAVLKTPLPKDLLPLSADEIAPSLGLLRRAGAINIKKDGGLIISATKKATNYIKNNTLNLSLFIDAVAEADLNESHKVLLKELQSRRGFIKKVTSKKLKGCTQTSSGKSLAKDLVGKYKDLHLVENLTSDLLKTGSWKGATFRHYNTELTTPTLPLGRRQPQLQANDILRDIFIEMGFKEIEGPMVESAFWNNDVMWFPQDHPSRDEQDTFYLDGNCKVDKQLMKSVKEMHENGIKRTHTIKGDWTEEIATKRLLRTHSTASTFRTLAKLAAEAKKAGKDDIEDGMYYYIAHSFRNEAIDATHLAELFQAEGFIVGDDLSLADLMGFIKEFYARLGLTQIRFKPTYNPYTEPSMEAHYYDPKLKKWYALINSGIFRFETLRPLGINKTIIAWGMGANRLAALLSGVKSMRDITGTTVDLEWLHKRPMMNREVIRK